MTENSLKINIRLYGLTAMFLLLISSCKDDSLKEKTLFYYNCDSEGHRSGKKADAFKYHVLIKSDSIKVYRKNQFIGSFMYKVDKEGIYAWHGKTSNLIYPFRTGIILQRTKGLSGLFYEKVELVQKKAYNVNGKEYTLFHFIESMSHETLDSYYLEGEGFICFYRYNEDSVLYLDAPKAMEVKDVLLRDTTFFALQQLRQLDAEMGRTRF